MRRTMKKLRSRSGMTLTEVLVCLAIMAILLATVASGANLAVKTFRSSVNSSDAQILTSTVYNALANELHYATNIQRLGGNIVFDSAAFGTGVYVKGDPEGTRVLVGSDSSDYKLLNDTAYTGGLNATAAVTDYSNQVFTLTITVSGPEISAVTTEFKVRALNADI